MFTNGYSSSRVHFCIPHHWENPTSPFWKRSALGFLWKEWCQSWNTSTLATSCEELTHWKRLWCWEGLGAGGEGDDRGWDGWMASLTQWTWVWVNSGSWWWTGRPGVLQFMGLQRVRHDWATELNWWLVGRGVRCYSHFRELRPSKLSKKGRTEAHTLISRLHSPCPSCSARCSLSNVNMLGLWDTRWRKITVIISRPLSSETNSTKFSYFLTQHNNLH